MKNILFFSPDLNFCASLLMFFNERYTVTTTTSLDTFGRIMSSTDFDLLVIDSEPNSKIDELCRSLNINTRKIPIIITYVYTIKYKATEQNLRKLVDAIFYKPIDMIEVSQKIDFLIKKKSFSPAKV